MKQDERLVMDFDTIRDEYLDFLTNCEQVDIFQDPRWLLVEAQRSGWEKSAIFTLKKNSEIKIGACVYFKKSRLFGKYLHIVHGPVIENKISKSEKLKKLSDAEKWGDQKIIRFNQVDLVKDFFEKLKKFATDQDFFAVLIEPIATQNSDMAQILKEIGFTDFPKFTLPKYPMFIDLEKDKEDLMNQMDKKTRYNVRYAERKGVEVEFFYPGLAEDDSNCINEFYSLLERASDKKEFDIPAKLYFLKAWREYEESYKNGEIGEDYWDTVCFALAKYKNQVVSANFSQFFGNWAGSYYTANSRKFSKLRASYYLKWATILEAQKRGKTIFDMWGHVPDAKKGDPGYGFSRFKYGFNPIRKVFTGRLGLPISSSKYALWRFLRKFT